MNDPETLERLYAALDGAVLVGRARTRVVPRCRSDRRVMALDIAMGAVDKAVAQIALTHVDDKLEDLLAELKQCKELLHETMSYTREEYDDKRNSGGQS